MKQRILTGDRPTGNLHLGHWVGSIQNRVALQDQYDCFFIIADLHLLTTTPEQENIRAIRNHAKEMVLDYLACGIDPDKSVIFLQSAVPQTYELNLLCEMLVTVPQLQRIPSLKEMKENAHLKEMPFGLLGYPVLQSADILLPRAHVVPIGKDNVAHVELTRDIARRFNRMYGEVFPVPEPLLSDVPTLVGTDGKAKMSKSLNNAIMLSDSPQEVERKVMRMFTDPNRIHADTPGTVEGNPVFTYHDVFNKDTGEVESLKQRYRKGKVSDTEVKQKLNSALNIFLTPLRERRAQYEQDSGFVERLIYEGTRRMCEEAQLTMRMVRKAMGLSSVWDNISRKARKHIG